MMVRQRLGALLNEVPYRHDTVPVTQGGKPVAALVDVGLFAKIRLMEVEFDRTLLAGEADCLVTGDHDSLALADRHPVLTPADFASRL